MSIPDNPQGREETYLAKMSGQNVSVPTNPQSREEEYLAHICGSNNTIPQNPQSRKEEYLKYIAENGTSGGGGGGGTASAVISKFTLESDSEPMVVNLGFKPSSVIVFFPYNITASNYSELGWTESIVTHSFATKIDDEDITGRMVAYIDVMDNPDTGEQIYSPNIDNSEDSEHSITITNNGFEYKCPIMWTLGSGYGNYEGLYIAIP